MWWDGMLKVWFLILGMDPRLTTALSHRPSQ